MDATGAEEMHLRIADPAATGPEERRRLRGLLCPEEQARMDRFHRERDRTAYLVAHGLLRLSLSRRAPSVPPERWQFVTGRHGRPELAGPGQGGSLRFNLSHTDGLVAVLVTAGGDCGVDVELAEGRPSIPDLARSVLSPWERPVLAGADEDQARRLFFSFWTLKEAYAKARGLGLALPFERFGFELGRQSIRLRADPAIEAAPGRWRFQQWWPTPRHVLALAFRAEPGRDEPRLVVQGS